MKLVIDSEVCKKYNLTLEEVLVLYLSYKEIDVCDVIESILDKNVGYKNLYNDKLIVLGSNARELLQSIIVDSNSTVKGQGDKRFEILANKLRDIYIPGKKEGTQDYFKGSSKEIISKLKKFFIEYGDFTDEQIINATKKYIESFNGDYKYAQLLKYFISKKVDGEKGSRLFAYIENADQEDLGNENNVDWTNALK